MGPHRHLPQAVRNFNAGLASGEWLFGFMGMDQYPLAQYSTIRPEHLPFVGIMIPAGIGMADHHMKIKAAVCSPLILNRDDISRPGKGRRGCQTVQDCVEKRFHDAITQLFAAITNHNRVRQAC